MRRIRAAHIQAIGRDAAGRLQYRYHPEWEKVREKRKAQRLIRLATRLPQIRSAVARRLGNAEPTREFALAAATELVAATAIRAGDEAYARQHGTRGAATLLKSNLRLSADTITLTFRAKGGKEVCKEVRSPRLAAAFEVLRRLPGKRLFQYRGEDGEVRAIRRQDINAFLRDVAGVHISLKDFRTLCASAMVLDALARITPGTSERQRRRQVRQAVQQAAESLANTPAICRKSYVHGTVVAAFEEGVLEGFASSLKACRSASRREQFVAEVLSLEA
jgi:DNA topoisomerase-1